MVESGNPVWSDEGKEGGREEESVLEVNEMA